MELCGVRGVGDGGDVAYPHGRRHTPWHEREKATVHAVAFSWRAGDRVWREMDVSPLSAEDCIVDMTSSYIVLVVGVTPWPTVRGSHPNDTAHLARGYLQHCQAARAHTMVQAKGGQAGPAHAGLACAVVRVVFTGSDACGAKGSQRRVRWPSSVDLGVDVERRLVVPEL